MTTRDELDWMDVERILGPRPEDDVETITCPVCWLMLASDWMTRLGHARWHVRHGDVSL